MTAPRAYAFRIAGLAVEYARHDPATGRFSWSGEIEERHEFPDLEAAQSFVEQAGEGHAATCALCSHAKPAAEPWWRN